MRLVLLDAQGNPVSETVEVAPGESATFTHIDAPATHYVIEER